MQTQPPQLPAVTAPLPITCVYVSSPVQLATIKTKNPAQHATHVYQVRTTMKLEKRCAKDAEQVHTAVKLEEQHANHVYQVLTTMKLGDRFVKVAQLANTVTKLENRLVEIVQLGKIQQQVHLIVQSVAMQKLIIQNMKRIVIR